MNTVPIPGTDFIALADDRNLTPKAIEAKTIKLEHSIANCPLVTGLTRRDLVLDIGAFIGDTALIFLDHTDKVLAFEPQTDAFFCLEHNSPRSINWNAAVGDGRLVGCHQDAMDGNLGTRTVGVGAGGQSLTIDRLALTKVALMKIDVEGFEPAVLDGAAETIRRCRPKLLIEIYPQMLERQRYSVDGLYARLRNLGYEWKAIIGNETEPRWDIGAWPK